MRQISLRDRLRYRFDATMSAGPLALIGWLSLASLVFIVAMALAQVVLGIRPEGVEQNLSFGEAAWLGLMRTLDAGTMGGDAGWSFRLASLLVTLGGIFLISTLIGVLTTGIEARLETLRKGRSLVVEQNHTVILGWSPQVFTIVSELVLANANQSRPCIAILADRDKVEMEDEIRAKLASLGNTRVVCRSGRPMDLADLEIVNPNASRSIIVLAPETGDPDAQVIKSILALTNNPGRRKQPYHIVAEIRDPQNMEVARMVGRDEVELVLTGDLIARLSVQTCRQSGLSVVYTELLDFGGDEIYFKEEPELVGKSFGEALSAYQDSSLIGLRTRDGRILLNPSMSTAIAVGDKVIAISEDDDTIKLSGRSGIPIDSAAIREPVAATPVAERTLILGWNRRGPTIVGELDNYVTSGSEIKIVADSGDPEGAVALQRARLRHQSVVVEHADTTDRRVLDGLAIHTYHHVIVLGYSDTLGPDEADARTLITLLHLRDIADKGGHRIPIVSEMLDMRNRELAEVTRADDFIVSDRLISLMLSQISENKELNLVFADLFSAEGSELYLKPASDYVATGRPVDFYTVLEAARRRGEVAVGYRIQAEAGSAEKSHGVRVNPEKSKPVSFAVGDRVIVLAEN